MVYLQISDATVQSLLTLQSAEIARLHHKLADTESQFDQTITYRPSQDSDGSDVRVLREQLCDLVDKIKPIQMIHSVSEELEAANKSNLELQMSFEELKNDFVTLRTEKDEISGMLQSEKESKAALEEDLAQLRASHKALRKRIRDRERELDNTHKDYQMREANLRAEWAMSENDVKEEIFSLLNELDDQHVVTDDLRQQFCETTTEKNVKGFQLHEQLELYRKAQMQKTIVHVQELDAVRAELATCRAELEAVKQAEVRSTLEVPANDPLRTAAIDHPVPVMTSLTWSENLDKIKTMFVPITSTASLETFTKFLGANVHMLSSNGKNNCNFVWTDCPNSGLFVIQSQDLTSGDSWEPCEQSVMKQMQNCEEIEIVYKAFYLGTFKCATPEVMRSNEFCALPKEVQLSIIRASSCGHLGEPKVREMFLTGSLTATKLPVCKVGYRPYMTHLCRVRMNK